MNNVHSELIVRFRNGEYDAYEELYRKFRKPALHFCVSILKDIDESENIVQDVFLKIWYKRSLLNPDLNFIPYLFTIIKNQVYDYRKVAIKNEAINERFREMILDAQCADKEIKEARLVKIKEAVENLSARKKEIIKLNYERGLSYKEIAKELDIKLNTVKNQLVIAKKSIRKKLEQSSLPNGQTIDTIIKPRSRMGIS